MMVAALQKVEVTKQNFIITVEPQKSIHYENTQTTTANEANRRFRMVISGI